MHAKQHFFVCVIFGSWQLWELCMFGIVHFEHCAFLESTLPQKVAFRVRKNTYFQKVVLSTARFVYAKRTFEKAGVVSSTRNATFF